MSLYSDLKEICKDTKQTIKGKDFAGKIVYLLKTLSLLSVCFLYLMEECGLKAIIISDVNTEIRLPQGICDFLSLHMFNILVVYFVYFLILKPLIKMILVEIKVECRKDMFSAWYTVEDIVEILLQITILLKIIYDILECIKGRYVMQRDSLLIYAFVVIGALLRFIKKVYIQNKNRRYYNRIPYTDYVDSDGKRIAEEDRVVYRNKIYKLYNWERTWYLKDFDVVTDIKLENAVMDREGRLRVWSFDMGRRNEKIQP